MLRKKKSKFRRLLDLRKKFRRRRSRLRVVKDILIDIFG